MQLTRLEIKGFKSFADKVTINFDEGITGIVGPNGCGKSNVVDSIRWVLGEQKSRILRSDKMENVIFNGTKARKQTQMAEVSLTFNNTKNLIPTEYSQVTITRRYFRSGESEYLLNDVPCRLKDITNLFLDTGIASNTYAIIELKMVDDLLNDKDNSRRSLFEEAAGISKFKIRKKETLRKLEDTDADLARVEDLLFEIDKNLKSLERQAKQATRYYEIKEEYKQVSIGLAKKTLQNQHEAQSKIQDEITSQNDQKGNLNSRLSATEALIEQTKTDLINKEKLLSSRQKSLNDHVGKIRQYESEKKIKSERQRFLNDRIENLKELIDQDRQSNERASFSLKSLANEQETAEGIFQQVTERLEHLQSDYDQQKQKTQEAQAALNELNQSYSQKREEVFQLHKDIDIREIQLDTLRTELNKSKEDTTQHSEDLQAFTQKLEEISKEKSSKSEAFIALKEKEDALDTKIDACDKQIDLLREELTHINRQLDRLQNEYNLTKSLVDNLEGFPEAIKFLKGNDDWKETPLLSDIISCPEEYRVAIENFLEPYMNHYVANSYEEALKAVNLLIHSSHGRVNFFVLDRLESYHSSSLHLFEGMVNATEVVEYDSKYQKLIAHLLDNVFIYEGTHPVMPEDNAVFISKDGQIAQRNFGISGGSVGLFEGKRIGRAKNLEKLSDEIKKLTKKQEQTESAFRGSQNELATLKSQSKQEELSRLTEEINQVNEIFVTLQTKKEQFSTMLNSNEIKHEDLISRIEKIGEELKHLTPLHDSSRQALEELETKVKADREQLESLNELLSQKSTAYSEENVLFHRQQNKLNSIRQEITYKEEAFEASADRIKKHSEELQSTSHNLNELIKTSEQGDDELVAMYDEKESIENGVTEAEKEYYQVRGTIDEEEKKLREIQRQRESVDHLLMEWQEKLNETKLQLNSVKERLSVEFDVDIDQVEMFSDEQVLSNSEEELRADAQKLKNRLENMGPINPMAMEAYEEIKERHEFITAQKQDLEAAKESLMTTIGEIDLVARTTFLEAFEKIRDNFERVFRTLFTQEDDCELKLTDPENPLDSAIEIMAKPKGKKPLTINQLSGGEKTLTATSLLFAIYLLKPAPFCIFDEVDAPLDDANIDKFNEIIREFSKDSQFIIVTHNKRTMGSTDVIYGITMIEQGVSRVVPVDLRELA